MLIVEKREHCHSSKKDTTGWRTNTSFTSTNQIFKNDYELIISLSCKVANLKFLHLITKDMDPSQEISTLRIDRTYQEGSVSCSLCHMLKDAWCVSLNVLKLKKAFSL